MGLTPDDVMLPSLTGHALAQGERGPDCRGCRTTLLARAGIPAVPVARELLSALGFLPYVPRVDALVDAGWTNVQIRLEVPGATSTDVNRSRDRAAGRVTR